MSARAASKAKRLANLLELQEAVLRSRIRADTTIAAAPAPLDEVLDLKDLAAEDTQAVVTEAVNDGAARELAQVVAARQRLDEGSYGICEDCGDAIDERRLKALPHAAYCTSCQEAREKEAARH